MSAPDPNAGLRTWTLRRILAAVAQVSGIPEADIMGLATHRRFVEPRQVVYLLAMERPGASYNRVAKTMRRHHQTVMISVVRGKRDIEAGTVHGRRLAALKAKAEALLNSPGTPWPDHGAAMPEPTPAKAKADPRQARVSMPRKSAARMAETAPRPRHGYVNAQGEIIVDAWGR
jgi:hypothetical protein